MMPGGGRINLWIVALIGVGFGLFGLCSDFIRQPTPLLFSREAIWAYAVQVASTAAPVFLGFWLLKRLAKRKAGKSVDTR